MLRIFCDNLFLFKRRPIFIHSDGFLPEPVTFHQRSQKEAVLQEDEEAISPPTAVPIKPNVMKPQEEQGGQTKRASLFFVFQTRPKRKKKKKNEGGGFKLLSKPAGHEL